MGLLKSLFDKKEEVKIEKAERVTVKNTIYAPVSGEIISLEKFPDEVFSAEVLGKGCGIYPKEECIKAPFEGEIVQVADTKHAIGMKSVDGIELLIHIGVDTVEMKGQGFKTFVKEGDFVSLEQKLVEFSQDEIKKAGYKSAVAVIVTNSDDFQKIALKKEGAVQSGDSIMTAE